MTRVLITGANGFVGHHLCADLLRAGFDVCAATRRPFDELPANTSVGDIGPETDWRPALSGVNVVVHLAARVHVMAERHPDPLSEFRKVNTAGTLHLARQARLEGVSRLIYLSSIKVNGEQTGEPPFRADDQPNPRDPYAVSKREAEEGLLELARSSGPDVTIIRPPLVYGPGVKGNFERLVRLVRKGVPLPFGAVDNARSLVNVSNLTDLIIRCVDHDAARNEVFLVSDGEDLSTPGLIRRLARALEVQPRLLPVPVRWLYILAKAARKEAEIDRLVGSLQVDIAKTCGRLQWVPPVSVEDGLARTVAG